MEWNGAYDSDTIGIVTRKNDKIRVRFKVTVQDIEIGKFEQKMTWFYENKTWLCETLQEKHNEVQEQWEKKVMLSRELDEKTEMNNELQRTLEEKLTELGKSCDKINSLTALNTELLKQLKDARNKVSSILGSYPALQVLLIIWHFFFQKL